MKVTLRYSPSYHKPSSVLIERFSMIRMLKCKKF